jgi:hypothetical protein
VSDKDRRSCSACASYLDIDGTILFDAGSDETPEGLDFQHVCDGLAEFLEFVVAHCEPFWLSYRSRLGSADQLEEQVFPHLPEVARSIRPAHWDEFKHEAIDPRSEFVWFEDDLEPEDAAWLQRHDRLEAFVRVDRANRDNPRLMMQEVRARLGPMTRRSG